MEAGSHPSSRWWHVIVGSGLFGLALFTAAAFADVEVAVAAPSVPASHIRFFPAVKFVVPTPACPPSRPDCEWLLWVNEPKAPGQPVVGRALGSSGTLTVPEPTGFCGIIQADALIGPNPWKLVVARRRPVEAGTGCSTTTVAPSSTSVPAQTPSPVPNATTTPAATVPAATTQLPFTGPAVSTAATSSETAPAELPFTGINVETLLLVGSVLLLAGVSMSWSERHRRALVSAARLLGPVTMGKAAVLWRRLVGA